ncbi:hypothetical protein B2M20_10780 [Nitrobacter vulgaris]|uniref:Uncharacterized protein n=1 Tax=Nitrobacter vulgaris TaxID=29421 RepID=A0A1V4HYS7_NITVU|nr:hypothetical protein B2M20_10780 [Nitrobacter vulgaris]
MKLFSKIVQCFVGIGDCAWPREAPADSRNIWLADVKLKIFFMLLSKPLYDIESVAVPWELHDAHSLLAAVGIHLH